MAQSSTKTSNKQLEAKTKSSTGKVKPSYKHVPHSQKPPHLVAKRNARERRRVQAVNQAFYKLRKCVPIENRNKRVSKVKTLQRAIDYIRKLERILAAEDEDNNQQQLHGSSQVAGSSAANNLSNNQQQQQASSSANHIREKRTKKSTNCDQAHQLQPTLDNHQQPQIMKQKRGRKASTSPSGPLKPAVSIEKTTMIPSRDLPNNCQQLEAIYNETIPEQQQLLEMHKFSEPYYTINNCPSISEYQQQQPQQQQQQTSEVLRESSAYNNSLNYYNNDQHQQQNQHEYPANMNYMPAQVEVQPTSQSFNMCAVSATNQSSNFYSPLIGSHASYTIPDISNSSSHSAAMAYPPAISESHDGWQLRMAELAKSDMSLNDSVGSTMSTPLGSTSANASCSGASNATADSSTSACSTSISFALLQSPSSSSTDSPNATTNSDNSSTVVCRPRGTTSVTNNRQQVNNYLIYAANRMEARAAHLSFAVNNSHNNDNNLNGYHNHNHHHQQQQQQSNERKNTTTANELGETNNNHHQVRHLLNGGNGHLNVGLSANNLHEQQQHHQYHRHHHQQQSFLNNQQHNPNSNHLSASQSVANNITTNSLIHQQTIQEYTSLPL